MDPLERPDSYHLSAAEGWLDLGDANEAAAELDRIRTQDHPDVLEMRWAVCARNGDWQNGLPFAERLTQLYPERAAGWLHRAYALRRTPNGGLQQAWDSLRPAYEKFPGVPVIPFNLACYAAQLGQPDEAWTWLQKAMDATDDPRQIKEMALADPDLQPIHDRVRESKA